MKINNQYQEAEAIYPVTGLYIDPEGSAVEKSEMLLSEHRMDAVSYTHLPVDPTNASFWPGLAKRLIS